jgi:hypothetical protein
VFFFRALVLHRVYVLPKFWRHALEKVTKSLLWHFTHFRRP